MKSVLVLLSLLLCFSCGFQDRKLAYQSQRNLDEADLYLEHFDIPQALEKAKDAREILGTLLVKDPKNADYLLLESRANLTLFLAENAQTFQDAQIDSESFIKLPPPSAYKEYRSLLLPTIDRLKNLLSKDSNLTQEQQASAHTLLASIWRLNKKTLALAKGQYYEAIQLNESWLRTFKKQEKEGYSKELAINKIKNQLRNLRMSLIEVELLSKEWHRALSLLEKTMGGPSLEYFRRNFKFINTKIEEVEKKLNTTDKSSQSKSERLLKLIEQKKKTPSNPLLELASNSVEENARLQLFIDLTDTQNNLIYRMICYQNLDKVQKFSASMEILQKYYPELGKEIQKMFKPSKDKGVEE